MNRDDVIDVFTAVYASDHRTIGEGDIALWSAAFEMCGHAISKPDAIAAVVRHALDPTAPYLKPGHVVAGAREIARDRMLRETPEQRQARTDAIDAVIEAKAAGRAGPLGAPHPGCDGMSTPVLDLDALHLEHGSHSYPNEGVCLLEAVALFAGEKHTDHPACVSPLLADVGIRLNDRATDTQRQDLKRFIPLVVGTAGDGQDDARRWLAVDRSVRFLLPKYLDKLDHGEQAATLRALPRITDAETYRPHAKRLRTVVDEMYELRRNRYETIRAAVRKAVKDKPAAVAVADAVAVAVAVADAVAVAVAVAGADAVAVAVAGAVADAVAVSAAGADADDPWNTTYEAVYAKVKPIYQEKCAGLIAESWDDAVALYADLINPVVA